MAALAEQHQRFDKMGAEIITVSCDTQFVHLAWKKAEGELADVRYKMGADPSGRLARLFGVYEEDAGLALRGTFVINPEGRLLNSEVNFFNLGRNIDELMRRFKANLYLARKQNEACPSKWKDEGDKTLTPSAKMVGKVLEALSMYRSPGRAGGDGIRRPCPPRAPPSAALRGARRGRASAAPGGTSCPSLPA